MVPFYCQDVWGKVSLFSAAVRRKPFWEVGLESCRLGCTVEASEWLSCLNFHVTLSLTRLVLCIAWWNLDFWSNFSFAAFKVLGCDSMIGVQCSGRTDVGIQRLSYPSQKESLVSVYLFILFKRCGLLFLVYWSHPSGAAIRSPFFCSSNRPGDSLQGEINCLFYTIWSFPFLPLMDESITFCYGLYAL